MEIEAAVAAFIGSESLDGEHGNPLRPDDSLLRTGALDSLTLLKLLVFIEERYQIKVDNGDVVPDNFETVRNIRIFIERKQQALAS
jgi:acyl carrier protein